MSPLKKDQCPKQKGCVKHRCGVPVPHHWRRKCCGLGGCGPHGCNCFCGVSCHSPLCCCPPDYKYFLCHPEPHYPYTQPDYDGAAGLKKLCEQCCDCPPYFQGGFRLDKGCKKLCVSGRRGGGLKLRQGKCGCDGGRKEAIEEAKRREQFFTRIKKPCTGDCMDDDCESCSQKLFDTMMDSFLRAKRGAKC